jgi:hypothetical protein
MKTLSQGDYHAQRETSTIPNRRPVRPTGKLILCATLKIKDNVAFFHRDENGIIWQSYHGRDFRQQHIYYAACLNTFFATVFNAGWYSIGACRWSPAMQRDWLSYVASRAKVIASGFTNF